jgi:hypothetical protein
VSSDSSVGSDFAFGLVISRRLRGSVVTLFLDGDCHFRHWGMPERDAGRQETQRSGAGGTAGKVHRGYLQNSANRLRAAHYSRVETAALNEPRPHSRFGERGSGAFRRFSGVLQVPL